MSEKITVQTQDRDAAERRTKITRRAIVIGAGGTALTSIVVRNTGPTKRYYDGLATRQANKRATAEATQQAVEATEQARDVEAEATHEALKGAVLDAIEARLSELGLDGELSLADVDKGRKYWPDPLTIEYKDIEITIILPDGSYHNLTIKLDNVELANANDVPGQQAVYLTFDKRKMVEHGMENIVRDGKVEADSVGEFFSAGECLTYVDGASLKVGVDTAVHHNMLEEGTIDLIKSNND